ncbi:MAG: hypothetical protein ACI8ZX_002186 [Planctomycetota bacterium]|jgi:hypothetical protein
MMESIDMYRIANAEIGMSLIANERQKKKDCKLKTAN